MFSKHINLSFTSDNSNIKSNFYCCCGYHRYWDETSFGKDAHTPIVAAEVVQSIENDLYSE